MSVTDGHTDTRTNKHQNLTSCTQKVLKGKNRNLIPVVHEKHFMLSGFYGDEWGNFTSINIISDRKTHGQFPSHQIALCIKFQFDITVYFFDQDKKWISFRKL